MYIALYDDIPVGALCSKLEDKKRLHILQIAVLKPYRRLGVGTRLVEKVYEYASKKGLEELFIDVPAGNSETIEFLKRLGFTTSNEVTFVKTITK